MRAPESWNSFSVRCIKINSIGVAILDTELFQQTNLITDVYSEIFEVISMSVDRKKN